MKKNSHFFICLRLMSLVKPLGGFMVLAILLGLLGHLCATFIPILGGYAILHTLGTKLPFSLSILFLCLAVFAMLRGVFHYGEQACNHYIAFKLLALIRDKTFQALRRLCPAKLEGKDKGNLISLITSDIELLEVFYAHTISPAVIAFFQSLLLTAYIGSFHWSLGVLAVLAYVVVAVLIPLITSRLNGDSGTLYRAQSGELSTYVLDSLRGLNEILQYGMGEKRMEEMNEKTDALACEDEKMKLRGGKSSAATNTVILCFDMAVLFLGAHLYLVGVIGFNAMIISLISMMSSFGPVIALANLGTTLQNTFAAGERVLAILDETPVVEKVHGKADIKFGGANVKNLGFSYGKEQILSDFSLAISQNQIIGVVGKSGSGKSTFLKLLMRFWQIQKGSITISDTDIDHINTSNLRSMEGFVTQETYLFHDSIRNNIKIARQGATDEEMISACKQASIHDFISSLSNGYDTSVGELGDTLSGGERQRIGLARAFLHNAPLLLLDEPTSNLDSLNEAIVLRSISKAQKDKTVVLVSHRKSTMRITNQVYQIGG